MSEDKQRSFFSWLNFRRKEEEQQRYQSSLKQTKKQSLERPEKEAPNLGKNPANYVKTSKELDNIQIVESIISHPPLVEPIRKQLGKVECKPMGEVIRQEGTGAISLEPQSGTQMKGSVKLAEQVITQDSKRQIKKSLFIRLKSSLLKTKQNIGSNFISLFRGKRIDDNLFEELEEQLLIADVGVKTTRKIITTLIQHSNRKNLNNAEVLYGQLKTEMLRILEKIDQPLNFNAKNLYVMLIVGVNGVGKTTTIGKLACQFQHEGKSVMLAAGDTFRAAAIEQLQAWGDRSSIPVVAQHIGADSASVIFDAIQAAKARGVDVLIADTAGRLQNKTHLMNELKKIVCVIKKLDPQAPHEVMLTIDASTGQNAISQAKLFNESVGLTGIILTKLDGTAKGGVIFAIADQLGMPIRYIATGEGIEDLQPFKANNFIEALFSKED